MAKIPISPDSLCMAAPIRHVQENAIIGERRKQIQRVPRYTSCMPEADSKECAGPFPGGGRYNAYGRYLRDRFGCRVYKVIVDAGFTCPNRDGTVAVGGCTYCDNDSFRPES